MKIQKSELAAKLNMVKGIVPKKSTMPVIQGVLVKDGYLIANDMEVSASVKMDCECSEEFLIPSKAFDLINSLPDGDMEMVVEQGSVTIKQKRIKNRYATVAPDGFPRPEEMKDEGETYKIDSEQFTKTLKRVMFAVAVNDPNPLMRSMCLRAHGGKLNFIGLDGHVIAWDKMDYDGEFEMLLPRSAIEKLTTMGLKGELTIRKNQRLAEFKTEGCTLTTRLVEGVYFDVSKVLSECPLKTVADRGDLLSALTRARMCITEDNVPIKMSFKNSEVELGIISTSADYSESVELLTNMEQELMIAFNPRLLISGLKSFEENSVEMDMASPKAPFIIKSEETEYFVVVLPVMVKG